MRMINSNTLMIILRCKEESAQAWLRDSETEGGIIKKRRRMIRSMKVLSSSQVTISSMIQVTNHIVTNQTVDHKMSKKEI